jgi:hypothetical protein
MKNVEAVEQPIKVVLYGQSFCAVEDSELYGFSVSGANCIKTLASRLLAAGLNPDQQIVLYRAGERCGRTTLAAAAFYGDEP